MIENKINGFPPCAGIIVFNNDETVLVNTKFGNYSFSKGKKNKGENLIDVAWRELEEETGLRKDQVNLIDDYFIDELSNRGNPSVRYFVGTINTKIDQFVFDTEELENVGWYRVEKALDIVKFKNARKQILKQAYQTISSL
jgi:8-oxo-dGTP pyrophosphatase MutT (NUDIX family)